MNRFEQNYYNDVSSIEKSLKRIANALENSNKKNENITAVTPTGDTIYYKTRRDMYMDNPCTKEEYEAHKANNIPGFEGTLDALDNLCNVGTNPKNDPERDKFEDDDDDLRETARMYTEELAAGNFKTKKDCILDYVTNCFGSYGARYTDIIKFCYYLRSHDGPRYDNSCKVCEEIKHLSTTAKVAHKWEYIHNDFGYNYRMPNLNAALGYSQIKKIKNLIKLKKNLSNKYEKIFSTSTNITFIKDEKFSSSNFWLNFIEIKNCKLKQRNKILNYLNNKGIQARPVWDLLSELPMYKKECKDNMSEAKKIANRVILLPSSSMYG